MTQALGHRSVAEAQACITAREFAEWAAYDRISPVGRERDDCHAALIAYMITKVFSSGGCPEVADFMPEWDKQPKTTEEIKQILQAQLVQHNKITEK